MLYHGSPHKLAYIDPKVTTEVHHKRTFASSSYRQAKAFAHPKLGSRSAPQRHSRNPYMRAPQSRIKGYVHHVPEKTYRPLGGTFYASDHVVRPTKIDTIKYSRKDHPFSRNEAKGAAAVVGAGALVYGGYRLHKHFHDRKQADRLSGTHNPHYTKR